MSVEIGTGSRLFERGAQIAPDSAISARMWLQCVPGSTFTVRPVTERLLPAFGVTQLDQLLGRQQHDRHVERSQPVPTMLSPKTYHSGGTCGDASCPGKGNTVEIA